MAWKRVLLQFIQNNVTERMVYGMLSLGRNFVSDLLCTLKCKKSENLKNLRTQNLFLKNVGFSQPWIWGKSKFVFMVHEVQRIKCLCAGLSVVYNAF